MNLPNFLKFYTNQKSLVPLILILSISIFTSLVSLGVSTPDGLVYQEWYSYGVMDVRPNERPNCANFEGGFCFVSYGMRLVGIPVKLFLLVWMVMCYAIIGMTLLMTFPSGRNDLLGPILLTTVFWVIGYFIYLQPEIVLQLIRQYVAGAFLILAVVLKKRGGVFLALTVSCLMHGSAALFLPFFLFRELRLKRRLALAVAFGLLIVAAIINIRDLGDRIFSLFNEIGHAIDVYYLKSLFYKWQLYSAAWDWPIGYPEVTYRGVAIIATLFFIFPVVKDKFHYASILIYFAAVFLVFRDNDLIYHRIYHYLREYMMLPGFLVFRWAALLAAETYESNRQHGMNVVRYLEVAKDRFWRRLP
jgi:hypothetical protein